MTTFDDLLAVAQDKKLPPVDAWRPEREGEIDIRIGADGHWFHEGSKIRRHELVKLFSTILRLDPDGYCLVTPAEKLRIRVEDAPFIAIDMETQGTGPNQKILFSTNVDDHVIVDAEHPIEVEDHDGEPRPYVHVRGGLRALIARSVFYRLVDLAEEEAGSLMVRSDGERFELGAI